MRGQIANLTALLAITALTAGLILSEAARVGNAREVVKYRALWSDEKNSHRLCVDHRMKGLEDRLSVLPKKEVNVAYQNHLADARQRFDRLVRGEAEPTAASAVPMPNDTPAPARTDGPAACPYSEAEAVTARATAQRLAALQAWVRENMEGISE